MPEFSVPSLQREEHLLRDHVQRLARTGESAWAIYVHLSRLRIDARREPVRTVAARPFDLVTRDRNATLYMLSNSDLVLVCLDLRIEDVDSALDTLRSLVIDDPLIVEDQQTGDDRFTSWFDLSDCGDIDELEDKLSRLADGAAPALPMKRGQPDRTPLKTEELGEVERRLLDVRVADLIRRQPTVDVHFPGRQTILFREHYVAMAELARRVAPGADLLANQWLFEYLTEILDRRLLAILGRTDFEATEDPISLNLHLSTLWSPDFQAFHQRVRSMAEGLIVEIRLVDALSDVAEFGRAREWLSKRGYRVLIDGVSPLATQFLDISPLKPHFVKLQWSRDVPTQRPAAPTPELEALLNRLGHDRIVLSHVDSEEAIRWGLAFGIHQFQGFFVDRLVDAMSIKGLI